MSVEHLTERSRLVGLPAAVLVAGSGIFPALLVGALAVQVGADLHLTEATLGMVISGFFLAAGILALPMGRLVDRVGWRLGAKLATAGSAVTLLGLAAAGGLRTFVAAMILGGLSHAIAMPASNAALAAGSGRRGMAFGIKQSAMPGAVMLAGLSVPLIALTVGWRWAFVAGAALPALGAIATTCSAASEAAFATQRRGRPTRSGFAPGMLGVSLGGGLAAGVAGALTGFFVAGAVAGGISEAAAGLLLAAVSAVGLVVRITMGWVVDRSSSAGFRHMAGMLLLGALGLVLLTTHQLWFAVGALLSFCGGWGWPGLFHFGIVTANPHAPGAATGMAQAALSTGAAAGPLGFGIVAHRATFDVAWVVLAVVAGAAAAVVLASARAFPRRTEKVSR